MYLDSAIIIKLFVMEKDSLFYSKLVDNRIDITVSNLSIPECRSSLMRKAANGEIDDATCEAALSKINVFLNGGWGVSAIRLDNAIFQNAAELISRCRGYVPLRTLDALHIAACISADAFPLATNDKVMRKAAEFLDVPLAGVPDEN